MHALRHQIAWIGLALLIPSAAAAAHGDSPSRANFGDPPKRLAVVWDNGIGQPGRVALMRTEAPWDLLTPSLEVGRQATLREALDRLYAVSPHAANIVLINHETWTTDKTIALPPGSMPLDIAVIEPTRAYVTTAGLKHLTRLDPTTGALTPATDLSVFAASGGLPDLGMLLVKDGRLFVQVRRQFELPAMIAVIDLATEELIDVDPLKPGVQAIELKGTAPQYRMQPFGKMFTVSAVGAFHDWGGIEMIDTAGLLSRGLLVQEQIDPGTNAQLGPHVLTQPGGGFMASSTDFALSSHIYTFSIAADTPPSPELHASLHYLAAALEFDSATKRVFVPMLTNLGGGGVIVFDAPTRKMLTPEPTQFGGGAISDLLLIP